MRVVALDVRPPSEAMADLTRAWQGSSTQLTARISFASPELLWQILTAKRWAILKALCGAEPMSIRAVARLCGRDVKAIHADVTALLSAGLLDRAANGGVVFPFDAIKVEFLIEAA